jgi:hypothetical protein
LKDAREYVRRVLGTEENVVQRSEDWNKLRLGCITSTRSNAILAEGAGQKSTASECFDLIGKQFRSAAMQRGLDEEHIAIDWWMSHHGTAFTVTRGGFCRHPYLPYITGSPDASADDGKGRVIIIEVKTTIAERPYPKWLDQVQHLLFVCSCSEGVLLMRNPITRTIRLIEVSADQAWQCTALAVYQAFYDKYLRWYWESS